jgi:hypothetical protein
MTRRSGVRKLFARKARPITARRRTRPRLEILDEIMVSLLIGGQGHARYRPARRGHVLQVGQHPRLAQLAIASVVVRHRQARQHPVDGG